MRKVTILIEDTETGNRAQGEIEIDPLDARCYGMTVYGIEMLSFMYKELEEELEILNNKI